MKSYSMGTTNNYISKHPPGEFDTGESWCLFGCMEEINVWDILTYVGQFAENSKKPVCKTRPVNFF